MANYPNQMRCSRQAYQQRPSCRNGDARTGTACGCQEPTMAGRRREETRCGMPDKSCEAPLRCENERRPVRTETNFCGCRRDDELGHMPIAMAYVPWQTWGNVYETCKGFSKGTIFKELDKPFLGRGGCNR